MQRFKLITSILLILINTKCSWRVHNNLVIPKQMKTIIFNPSDPESNLNRTIRKVFQLNGIKFIKDGSSYQNIPSLIILESKIKKDISSIFSNGDIAEYRITISVNAQIVIQKENKYPINVILHSLLFNDYKQALAKYTEYEFIVQEMYNKIAEDLMIKIINIKLADKYNNFEKTKNNSIVHNVF